MGLGSIRLDKMNKGQTPAYNPRLGIGPILRFQTGANAFETLKGTGFSPYVNRPKRRGL